MLTQKSYSVTLDGKALAVRFTVDERELVEAMFPRPDGTPGSMGSLARNNLIDSGSFKVQTTLVWAGVKHNGKVWTYDRVREAMKNATQDSGLGKILRPTLDAILAQGVLGKVVVEAEEPESDQGKAEATPTA